VRLQALLGGIFLGSFVLFAFWARFDAPYRDDWDWVLYQLDGAWLFSPHNEHVIPLARLLSRWQYAWGGLTGTLIQNAALVCHALTVALFWVEIRRAWPHRPAWRTAATGLMLVCLGFSYQLQSVVFGAAILFPLVQAATMVALAAVLQATEPAPGGSRKAIGRSRKWWVAAVVACAGSAASMTTGAVVPLIVAAIAWGRGASWRIVGGFGALSAAFVVAYFALSGFGPGPAAGEPGAMGVLARVIAVFAYVPAVFGGVVTSARATLGVIVGAIIVAIMAAAGFAVVRQPARASRLEWFSCGVMAFGVISALAVALGRIEFGVAQAAQSRYATFVLAAIGGLVLLGISRLDRSDRFVHARPALGASAVAMSALLLVPHVYVGLLWRAKADNIAAAYLPVRAGVADVAWLTTLHPSPDVVLRVIDRIEARGGSALDLGMLAPVAAPAVLPVCGGAWTLLRHGRQGEMRLAGFIADASARVSRAVIVDRLTTQVGVSAPAPLVAIPDPSPAVVNAAVWDSLLGRHSRTGRWLGSAQRGAGPPYRWLGRDSGGTWVCEQTLDVTPVTHLVLDVVRPDAAGTMVAIGWGFACGSAVSLWELRVDDAPVAVDVTTGVPRPDVEQARRLECAPGAPPGVHLRLDAARLTPGQHRATLHITTASGHRGQSAPLEFSR
jgi:hypothetical protein